jgi:hypothetical protein
MSGHTVPGGYDSASSILSTALQQEPTCNRDGGGLPVTECDGDLARQLAIELPDRADAEMVVNALTTRGVSRRRARKFAANALVSGALLREAITRLRQRQPRNAAGYLCTIIDELIEAAERRRAEAARADLESEEAARSQLVAEIQRGTVIDDELREAWPAVPPVVQRDVGMCSEAARRLLRLRTRLQDGGTPSNRVRV